MKKSIEYEDIENAKNLLGIDSESSIRNIRKNYMELVKSNHPDKFPESEKAIYEDKIKKINNAYKLIIDYCENYDISFIEEDFLKMKQTSVFDEFMKDWF